MQQLLFCLFPSILTFDFDLIFGLFSTFGGPKGIFLGSEESKTVLRSVHVVKKLFSTFCSMLTFEFDVVSRLFLTL